MKNNILSIPECVREGNPSQMTTDNRNIHLYLEEIRVVEFNGGVRILTRSAQIAVSVNAQ